MKRRAIVEILTAVKNADARPSVFIETNTAGKIVYGIRVSGANLTKTRLLAQEAFSALRAFVRESDAEDLRERMKMSGKEKA